MSSKRLVLRRLARRDVDQAIDHYLTHAGVAVSVDFIGALESLFDQISRQPASGSPRYAHELNIPGLRSPSMEKFPHIVFYLEDNSEIDIWRVLHGARDIPVWLRESGD